MKPFFLLFVCLSGMMSPTTGVATGRFNSMRMSHLQNLNNEAEKESYYDVGGEPKKACRGGNVKLPGRNRNPPLCGNENKDENRCLFACVAGGFYHGICTRAQECFCYRNNPTKGFIIEKRTPIMRRVKTKEAEDENGSETDDGNVKEITFVTDDYTTGYVDVDVNVNLEWDLSYLSEWFQSFNFYNNLQCDPCLCPAGCALYGYFSGYCTPLPTSECMCATAAKRPAS